MDTVDVLGSVIVALGNNFAATESQITEMTTEIARATAVFGVSSAQASALAAAMASVGVKSEVAGTSVGRVKAHKPHEFGVKASIATTLNRSKGGQFAIHAKSPPGRPHDGHTLATVIPEIEDLTGATLNPILAATGYNLILKWIRLLLCKLWIRMIFIQSAETA